MRAGSRYVMMICRSKWHVAAMVTSGVLTVSCAAPTARLGSPAHVPAPFGEPLATLAPAPPTATSVRMIETSRQMPTPTMNVNLATSIPRPIASTQSATSAATVVPVGAPTATLVAGAIQKLNLDELAPPGEARELFFNNCTSCHSFVCAVRGQRSIERWNTIKRGHRNKVIALGDEEYDSLFAYLTENFNDGKPEPEIPPELIEGLNCTPL